MPEIPRPTRKCAATGREIQPNQPFRATLWNTDSGWERRDYALDALPEWSEEPLASWETQIPGSTKPKQRSTEPVLFALIENEDAEPALRFAAASLLLEAKALKLREVLLEDGREVLLLSKPRGKQPFRVLNPGLSEAELKKWEEAAVIFAERAAA